MDGEGKKFTGHERDQGSIDYMHARYYNPFVGRFLSVDPGKDWDPKQPQSWNMYAYSRNNPINLIDPDGEAAKALWKLVQITASGIKTVARDLRPDAAMKAAKQGFDVQAPSDDAGRHLATQLGGGKRPIKEIHGKPEDGYCWHYHPHGRPEGIGHIFVGAVIGVVTSLIPGLDAEATGMNTANPILERRAQAIFGRSYFELSAEQRRAVFKSAKEERTEKPERRRDDAGDTEHQSQQ